MKLHSLSVENFGVFRGEHVFDLTATNSDEHLRNLALFSGHNGAGKSTLFQAVKLALHGRFVLGDRTSHQEYNDFVLSRLHRYNNDSSATISDNGRVTLRLEYIQSGSPLNIRIKRHWKRAGTTVSETLSVLVNDQTPDVREEDYQFWLNEIFPPGLAPICFYDAEQLDTLSNPTKQPDGLKSLISRLSGLDLVERLKKDLDYYLQRQRGGQKITRLRDKVLLFQADLDDNDARLQQLQIESENLTEEQINLEISLSREEQNLAAEGGTYAARRPILKERLAVLDAEIVTTSDQLRELTTQLLPFALAPELCYQLSRQLTFENDLYRQQVAHALWQSRAESLEESLLEDNVWKGIRASKKNRQALIQRVLTTLEENGIEKERNADIVHYLAEPEYEQLQKWILQAMHSVPQQVDFLGRHLRELREEQQEIKDELHRAPDNEVLTPLYDKIAKLESALEDIKEQQRGVQGQIGAENYKREGIFRQFHRAGDELRDAQANQRQLGMAERSGLVLRSYQDALIQQRLSVLEKSLVESFNTICRKEHLLTAVEIDPDTFEVTLLGDNEYRLNLNEFSAGESQLYAMALLHALRQMSQHQLPLIIDTPMARLDETHRQRLICDYFPTVSDQVVLFATGAEMDAKLIEQAKPSIARIYRLTFDSENQESTAELDAEYLVEESSKVIASLDADPMEL